MFHIDSLADDDENAEIDDRHRFVVVVLLSAAHPF